MTKEYDYDLPGDFDVCAADYVSENVYNLLNGKPYVADEYGIPADVEAAPDALCGRAVSIGDDGTTGWLLPCHEVAS